MTAYQLRSRLLAPLPITQTFRVFQDPRNLGRITPPSLGFQIASNTDIEMRTGAEIDYTIRWLGLPLRWKTLISAYDPPHSFTDEQLRGPYTLWRHVHSFEETAGGTVVSDCVDYRLPFGPLGAVAHRMVVARQLRAIFTFRQRAMDDLLGVPCRTLQDPVITIAG